MIRNILFLLVLSFASISIKANGVLFSKDAFNSYLTLKSSSIEVSIENQVVITKATRTFLNQYGESQHVKYGFPVPENASATGLRYYINGRWFETVFSSAPQDTATGGPSGNVDELLVQYLGSNPLYFNLDHRSLWQYVWR